MKFPALIIALATLLQAATLSDTCNQNTWVTNGPVYAIAPAGDRVYIGGSFSLVGPYTGGGVPINSSTGAPVSAFPKINGTVYATCTDGNGGWFVGGSFTSVDGLTRNNIAHILSNGSLDPTWNPNANRTVNSIAVSGTTIFAGGAFDSIGGQSRNHIAALDATSGNALAWNPNVNGDVNSLALSGTTIYAGGVFDGIGGQSRNHIAALDVTTGNALAWNPNANSIVYSLAVSGTTVYAGGDFYNIGGQARSCIAALDATTGNATTWNPIPAEFGPIYSLVVSGTTVFAGGGFDTIGAQGRNYIAALDATTGDATAWSPNANSTVYSLVVSGTTIFAGGGFGTTGGQSRSYIAALDATTGNVEDWNPNASGTVYSLAVSGTTVYAGGNFTSIGGQSRSYIAALDKTTGNALGWNPKAFGYYIDPNTYMIYHGNIQAIAISGSTVCTGGFFDSIGGQGRNNIAALDATTGNALTWNPNALRYYVMLGHASVNSIAVSGTTIYAGGVFDGIGGQNRQNIAALNATTGNALPWNPSANGTVRSLVVSGVTVYVGGEFTSIGQGVGHSYFAQFDSLSPTLVIHSGSPPSGLKNAGLKITNPYGSHCAAGALVKFAYSLPKAGYVFLRIYSLNGQLQSELVNKYQPAGNYSLTMQKGKLAAGAYLVVFKAGDFHQEKMISLMK